jgi:hypothetical protein
MITSNALADEIAVDWARMVRTITANHLPVGRALAPGNWELTEPIADRIRAIYRNQAVRDAQPNPVLPDRLRPWTTLDTVLESRLARGEDNDRYSDR